jgi:hypothetical protein
MDSPAHQRHYCTPDTHQCTPDTQSPMHTAHTPRHTRHTRPTVTARCAARLTRAHRLRAVRRRLQPSCARETSSGPCAACAALSGTYQTGVGLASSGCAAGACARWRLRARRRARIVHTCAAAGLQPRRVRARKRARRACLWLLRCRVTSRAYARAGAYYRARPVRPAPVHARERVREGGREEMVGESYRQRETGEGNVMEISRDCWSG